MLHHLSPTTHKHAAAIDVDRVVLRMADEGDVEALARLEQLDSRRLPGRDVVVAEADGELIAAADRASGVGIADPFRPSAPVLSLLRTWASAR